MKLADTFDQVLEFDLDELITCGGMGGFLELAELLAFAGDIEQKGTLSDVSYKPVGVREDGLVRIRITANIVRE